MKPKLQLEIVESSWPRWSSSYKRHHYLADSGPMAFATCFEGYVGDQAVLFMGMSGMAVGKGKRMARACRLVCLPEWQGAGLTIPFLEALCERELDGTGYIGKPTSTILHTAHPALCHVLRRSPKWRQISGKLSADRGKAPGSGMGGHMRAVAGFKYFGQAGVDALDKKATEE